MEWVYDSSRNSWDLRDNTSVLARIFIKEKPGQINAFRAKTLIASIYYGSGTFSSLTKRKKDWRVFNRKFKNRQELEAYIEVKKKSVFDFVNRA